MNCLCKCRFATVALCGALVALPARGHDSWLIADTSACSLGDELWLSFVTGERFPFGEQATDPARVASFEDACGGRSEQLLGYKPEAGGLSIRKRTETAGLHVFGCALKPRLIRMTRADFEKYLREERAGEALKAFSKSASPDAQEVVEEYTKFAKTIVQVGPRDDADRSNERPLGHRLEIVPLSNPVDWRVGQTAEIKVLLDGHAWANVAVSAGREGRAPPQAASQPGGVGNGHEYAVRTVTDVKGLARVKLDRAGHWFIKVHLVRPITGMGRIQWESFWASLTFRVKPVRDVSAELRSIREFHHGLAPAAVAGYRMSRAALAALDAESSTADLFVIQRCLMRPSYAALADGVQAAAGVSVGRLNLHIEEVSDEQRMELLFLDRSTGRWLVARLTPLFRERIRRCAPGEQEALAMQTAVLPPDEVFDISALQEERTAVSYLDQPPAGAP